MSETEIATLKGLPNVTPVGVDLVHKYESFAVESIRNPFRVGICLVLITQRSALARATLG
jgi:hypothetical protein